MKIQTSIFSVVSTIMAGIIGLLMSPAFLTIALLLWAKQEKKQLIPAITSR
ncbi:MAG: hypothetical protein MRY78_18540 [Saprospiraceae bacterium]|nr:hypothetical protein [Saprospiraceae bacterium]